MFKNTIEGLRCKLNTNLRRLTLNIFCTDKVYLDYDLQHQKQDWQVQGQTEHDQVHHQPLTPSQSPCHDSLHNSHYPRTMFEVHMRVCAASTIKHTISSTQQHKYPGKELGTVYSNTHCVIHPIYINNKCCIDGKYFTEIFCPYSFLVFNLKGTFQQSQMLSLFSFILILNAIIIHFMAEYSEVN